MLKFRNFERLTNIFSRIKNKRQFSCHQNVSHPLVGKWLVGCAGIVFSTVVVGGITRLTESGLSITEWNVIRGIKYPKSTDHWNEEFEKYKQTPEYKILNGNMKLEDFKRIYYWEWMHRMLGRLTGIIFLAPTIYFTFTKTSQGNRWMSPGIQKLAWISSGLVGMQGGLGWYMVKSGLQETKETPRVSPLRLSAHLGMAAAVYVITLTGGLKVLRNSKIAANAAEIKQIKSIKGPVHGIAGLVFITMTSGAIVAGLDAGLIYGTWPKMGNSFIPPANELITSEKIFKNLYENPVLAQFDHRMLAYITLGSILSLIVISRRKKIPSILKKDLNTIGLVATAQAALGIGTLLHNVPISMAATHQAGSLILMSSLVNFICRASQYSELEIKSQD